MNKSSLTISLAQAKLLALQNQGLLQSNFGKEKSGALALIEHLGYVQIDTLAVVARAHHHTLWSRLPDYEFDYLNELQEKDKTIFEYWSHAASYLPMSEYRFSLPRKKLFEEGKSHWFEQDKKMKKYVLDKIKVEGALQSKDFEHKRNGSANWYEWKPAKQALEQLFMEGKLMIAKRQGFQKVYDITERVLPTSVDTTMPSEMEYAEHIVLKAVATHGMVNETEISYLRNGFKETINKAIKQLLKDSVLIKANVEGIEKGYLTTQHQLDSIEKLKPKNNIYLLSPFDNMVIQRKRIQNIFDYDYMIECYLPESKRKYGYFSLPILYNQKFVARLDPKADRASKIFYIKSMHFEKGFKPDELFNKMFVAKLKKFISFNGCDTIVIDNADKKWKREIMKWM